MERILSKGAFKQLVSESSNEFKAKIGAGAETENEKNNGKAYEDIKEKIKNFDGGLQHEVCEEHPKYEKKDGNRTTLDYDVDNVTDEFKTKVKAQALGYNSELEMNNGIEKAADYSDNENIYNGIKDCGEKIHANIKANKQTGLRARMMPDGAFDRGALYEGGTSKDGNEMRQMIDALRSKTEKPKSTIHEENRLKTAYFKRTAFISENHMKSRIPDEFKTEGQQFRMKDKDGQSYICEWSEGKANILSHDYPAQVEKEFTEMRRLNEGKKNTTSMDNKVSRLSADASVEDVLNKMRSLMK